MHIMKTLTNIQRKWKSPGKLTGQPLQKRKSNVERAIINKP
jgi:hypothetical protein